MIIFDDFEANNITRIESFYSSAIYNRIVLSASKSGGFYVFVPNFGPAANVTLDIHWEETRIQSGNLPTNIRAIVNYINNKSELRAKGITARVLNNFQMGGLTFSEAILVECQDAPESILFNLSPYYLVRSFLDYTTDVTNNRVRFVPYTYDPNVLYGAILNDAESELAYGTQILTPDINFIGDNFASYKNLVNNYLGFYKDKYDIVTLEVDAKIHNLLPLKEVMLKLSASNIDKYKFLVDWESYEDYYYMYCFLISSTKIDSGLYKIKVKEIK